MISQAGFCQNQFSKSYDIGNGNGDWGKDVFVNDSNNYVIFSGGSIASTGLDYRFARIINQNQEVVKIDSFSSGNNYTFYYDGYAGYVQQIQNSYYAAYPVHYYGGIDSLEFRVRLTKYNSNLDTIFNKEYKVDSVSRPNSAFIFSNGDLGIVGLTKLSQDATDWNGFVLRVDTNGNIVWQHTYGFNNRYDEILNAYEDFNHNIVLGADYKYASDQYYNPWILVLNQNGIVIKNKYYTSEPLYNLGGAQVIPLNDSTYYQFGYLDSMGSGDFDFAYFFAKCDTNFQREWQIIFSQKYFSGPSSMKILPDSSIVVVGVKNIEGEDYTHGWIMKLSKNGIMLWERLYKFENSTWNYFNEFQVLPDSGFIIGGNTDGTSGTQDLWLVRLDKHGCLVPGCQINDGVVEVSEEENNIEVFPNPTSGEFNIQNSKFKIGDAIEVHDLLGRKITSQKISGNNSEQKISLANFASGIYLLRIVRNGKILFKKKL